MTATLRLCLLLKRTQNHSENRQCVRKINRATVHLAPLSAARRDPRQSFTDAHQCVPFRANCSCRIAREHPQSNNTDRGNVVKNLFVGNLSSEVTHEELRRLFETYGQVVQVHIIVDRDTGLPRGFAFVEMTNDAEAEKAIQALNGSVLRDRTLDVNYARPRPERPAA